MRDETLLALAKTEARLGMEEGGIPVGAVLANGNRALGRGHNRRVQQNSAILHGETDCLENAGRLAPAVYADSTIATTLSPCHLCTGAILLYGIPRVVVGENKNYAGAEDLLRSHGVEVVVLNDAECIDMMQEFIAAHPDVWNEDVGRAG